MDAHDPQNDEVPLILSAMPFLEERRRAWEFALSCVGIRYHITGKDRGSMDCAGPFRYVAKMMGWSEDGWIGYGRNIGGATLEDALDQRLVRVDAETNPLPIDALLVRVRRRPDHLLLVGFDGRAVHSTRRHGVQKMIMDATWWRRVVRAYRFREVC